MALQALVDEIGVLGDELAIAYRRRDADEAELPALAADALAGLPTTVAFDPAEAVALLLSTSTAQQPTLRFSDLPLTLVRHRDFYIELLVWTRASTSIHEHAFTGAFKVVSGSSLHTTYRFDVAEVVGPDLRLGSVHALATEYLPTGSIRSIVPGPDGLVHSLYHLEEPSLSVVVRTYGSERHSPQLEYLRPHVALNVRRYDADELTTMLGRALRVARQVDPGRILPIWLEQLVDLDLGRFTYLYLAHPGSLSEAEREEVIRAAEARHGTRARLLADTATTADRVQRLVRQRSLASDPDIRFLVACLMQAPDRAAVLGLVRSYRPDDDPVRLCAEWLAHLSQGRVETERLLTEFADNASIEGLRLGRRLAGALPDGVADRAEAAALFQAYLREDRRGDEAPEIRALAAALSEIEELASLR